MKSQRLAIKKYLLSGKSITPLSALHKFGCLRLGGRIYELRAEMDIETSIIKRGGKRYASYRIA